MTLAILIRDPFGYEFTKPHYDRIAGGGPVVRLIAWMLNSQAPVMATGIRVSCR